MKMTVKKKSLLVRVTAIALALGVAAMLLSGAVLYRIFHERASANMENTLNKQIDFLLYPLIKFQSLDWLLSYWQEHWQEMELPPFHDTDTYEKWSTERSEFYYLNITALTAEELREMSAQRQRYFAEYCYLEIMLALAMNRPHTDIDAVSCFIPNASGEGAFAVFLSTDEDTGFTDQRMVLGDAWDFHAAEHPEAAALYEQDFPLYTGIEISRSPKEGTEYASKYSRIGFDHRALFAVSASMQEMKKEIWSDVYSFEKWVALIILAAILTMLCMIYRSSLKSTLTLARNIRAFTRDKSAEKLSDELKSLINRGDEIGALAGDIRDMVEQNELYYRQKLENEALTTKLLLAQIKPHFIYNCLAVIRSCVDEPQKAEEALNHFAGFLRGSVDMLEETACIPADREFKTVDDYLYMQKLRFEDRLSIVTDYRDRSFFIPAFSLQMLVENAVEHGISGSKDLRGTVRIRSFEKDGFHVVEVEDNGAGILPEKFEAPEEEQRLHVGLRNVEQRLKRMCRGTLTIRSPEGKGTLAVIRIPK